MIVSNENPKPLRDLKSQQINKMVTVTGIVINSTKIIHKAIKICVICKNCNNLKYLDVFPNLFRFNEAWEEAIYPDIVTQLTNKANKEKNVLWILILSFLKKALLLINKF
jgi:DNA replicative helicase MCM subunit Mcm2 (Cdc46/Mcm family)